MTNNDSLFFVDDHLVLLFAFVVAQKPAVGKAHFSIGEAFPLTPGYVF